MQHERTQAIPRVIAVTGAAGYIGDRLVRRLLSEKAVERVIGIDVRPARIEHHKLTFLEQDITVALDATFQDAGVEAVVHLAFVLRQLRDRAASLRVNVDGGASVLQACEAARERRIVLMSSSTDYGAHPDNATELTEDDPLRPPAGFTYAADKAACETIFQRYGAHHEGSEPSILRGCVVMGPNARNFITAALDKPVLIGVGGADPPMQFLHEEDLLTVLWRFVSEPHPGTYNVAGPGSVRWSELVALTGKRLVRLPAPLAYGLTSVAWHLHMQSDAPGAGLDFVRWPWTVSTAKLQRELGYEFNYTSRQALESCLRRSK